MPDIIDFAFRTALVFVAVFVLVLIAGATAAATIHPVTAAAITALCVSVSIDAWTDG